MSHRSKPRGGRKPRRASERPSSPDDPTAAGARGASGNGAGGPPAGARPANGASNGGNGLDRSLLERAGETARRAPEIREELVARYRKEIAEGRYHPDPEEVAERIIRKGLLRDI